MTFPIIAGALGLAQFAPLLAKWFGREGKEPLIEEAIEIAEKLTGKQDLDQISQAFREDAKLVAEFQKSILEINSRSQMNLLKDRQDARGRDLALNQTGHRNFRADVMVIAAAIGLITCLGSLAFYSDSLPGEATGIISTIAGIFGACLKDAYAFEFGSSRGSKEKDSTVAAMIEKSFLNSSCS